MRDVATPVLSQHPPKGSITVGRTAIGFGQGKSSACGSTLLRQVQNYATHGMAGALKITLTNSGQGFLIDFQMAAC